MQYAVTCYWAAAANGKWHSKQRWMITLSPLSGHPRIVLLEFQHNVSNGNKTDNVPYCLLSGWSYSGMNILLCDQSLPCTAVSEGQPKYLFGSDSATTWRLQTKVSVNSDWSHTWRFSFQHNIMLGISGIPVKISRLAFSILLVWRSLLILETSGQSWRAGDPRDEPQADDRVWKSVFLLTWWLGQFLQIDFIVCSYSHWRMGYH